MRFLLQPAVVLGVVMVGLLWFGVGHQLARERDELQAVAFRTTRSLGRAVQEHVVRSITEPDRIMRLARASYLRNPTRFDPAQWLHDIDTADDVTLQLSLIGADGRLLATSITPTAAGTDFADRRHFQVHREQSADELYISEPVVGRITGKRSIQLSRAVRAADGTLLGVIVMSLDQAYFARFYGSVDLGKDGGIVLVGRDGVVRADSGFDPPLAGTQTSSWDPFVRSRGATSGSFVTRGTADGIERLVSFRAIEGYPLLVFVGISTETAFADVARYGRIYAWLAAGLTVFIVVAVGLSVRQRVVLERTGAALARSEQVARRTSNELALTLDSMSQGILMLDRDGRVAVVNRRATALLGLPEAALAGRPTFDDVLEAMRQRGEFGPHGELFNPDLEEFRLADRDAGPAVFERVRPNGQVIEVACAPTPFGGMVRTYTDITERRTIERRIAHMATHDALTGLANRTLFNARLEQAFAELGSSGRRFAVLVVDLDHFKEVNDAHGHPTGDALLQMAADRLRRCVHATDMVARLGGDEFAIVALRPEGESMHAPAQRILDTLIAPYAIDGRTVVIGASIGVASAPEHGHAIDALLRQADGAMYRVKAAGRNGICLAGQGPERLGRAGTGASATAA